MQGYEAHLDKRTGRKLYCGRPQCCGILGTLERLDGCDHNDAGRLLLAPCRNPGNNPACARRAVVPQGEIHGTAPGEVGELEPWPAFPRSQAETVLLAPSGYKRDDTGAYVLTHYSKSQMRRGEHPKYRRTSRNPLAEDFLAKGVVEARRDATVQRVIRPTIIEFPAKVQCPRCQEMNTVTIEALRR